MLSTMATRISDCCRRYEFRTEVAKKWGSQAIDQPRGPRRNKAHNWNNKCISRPNKDLIMSSSSKGNGHINGKSIVQRMGSASSTITVRHTHAHRTNRGK